MNRSLLKTVGLLMPVFLAACAGCASAKKAPPASLPKAMLPNHGMTESRAKGLGDAAKFAK
jgi:hypothetical protein